MNKDTIYRQAAIDIAMQYCPDDDGSCSKADRDIRELLDDLENMPSAQPNLQPTCNKLETDCISRQGVIDVLSQYPFEKVVNCISIIEEFPSAQPQDIARDIANIIENEKDMRVISKNAQTDIILCKDCKEYYAHDHRCRWWNHGTNEAGWCYVAERREDG